MTDGENLCGGKTFKEVLQEVNFHISDKERIEQLEKENEELRKRIEEYNLCGNTVDKQTYNEVVNENTLLKVKINNVTNFINACKRSAIANMVKSILDETIFQEAGEK